MLRQFLAAMAAIASACGGGANVSGLTEVSTNFDLQDVRPFLIRIAEQMEGFGEDEIGTLVDEISGMTVDREKSWDFRVTHEGQEARLHIRAFMDDVEAPDLYFFTSPALAAAIERALTEFGEERGW